MAKKNPISLVLCLFDNEFVHMLASMRVCIDVMIRVQANQPSVCLSWYGKNSNSTVYVCLCWCGKNL